MPLRLAPCFQRIERESDVAVLVIDERADNAARQPRRFVLDLLSGLVEFGLDLGRGRLVAQDEHGEREPRARERFAAIVPAQLLQTLFERLGDLVLHFLSGGAGPDRHHGHLLDGEGRVFGAPEVEIGEDAGNADGDEEKQRHRTLANGEGGQVEPALALGGVAQRPAPAMRTAWPWRSMCAPSATKRSPRRNPPDTAAASSPIAVSLTGRQLTLGLRPRPMTQTPGPRPRS